MDSYGNQALRDEVIYLHSLWHQGPPRSSIPKSSRNLQPSNGTQFKQEKRRKRGKRGGKGRNKRKEESDTQPSKPSVSEIEWPCPPSQSVQAQAQTQSEAVPTWPEFKPLPITVVQPPSDENLARFTASQVQRKALKATREFFVRDVDSDEDEVDEDEDENEDGYGFEELKFFSNLFAEDVELRGYYEKNWEKGEFSCLVCLGMGKTVKKFKDCVALAQHSFAISKTKKRQAHRAYGRAICEMLGWDISKLPSIVLCQEVTLDHNIASLDQPQSSMMSTDENKSANEVEESLNAAEMDLKNVVNCMKPALVEDIGTSGCKVGEGGAVISENVEICVGDSENTAEGGSGSSENKAADDIMNAKNTDEDSAGCSENRTENDEDCVIVGDMLNTSITRID